MTNLRIGPTRAVAAGALWLLLRRSERRPKTQNVVLIVSDGLRWQEVFTGAEEDLLNEKAGGSWLSEKELRKRYWRPSAERAPRAAVSLPVGNGGEAAARLIGNQTLGSVAHVTNGKAFSYPGYNEMSTGFPNPAIDSNEFGPNPTPTVFEWLNKFDEFHGQRGDLRNLERVRGYLQQAAQRVGDADGLDAAEEGARDPARCAAARAVRNDDAVRRRGCRRTPSCKSRCSTM